MSRESDRSKGTNLSVRESIRRGLKNVRKCGRLSNVKIKRVLSTAVSKLFGFVCFEEIVNAQRRLRESLLMRLQERQAYVREKVSRAERQRRRER
jgi:RNA recognition motif-containing protein